MRRLTPPLARAFRAPFLLWLMFMLTQPVPVHACPLRSAADVALSAQRVLAESAELCAQDQTPAPAHPHQAPCHCVGDCCHSVAMLPTVPPSVVPVPARIARQTTTDHVVEHSFEQPDYRLPPSTAPPASLA